MATRTLTRHVSLLAIGWLSLQTPAQAQTAAPAPAASGDIIVTAQKRAQSLQTVPIAVTALPAAAIEAKRIDNAIELGRSVPNLTVNDNGASLRGVGNLAISSTADSGLGYHVNGVYLSHPALEEEYFDLARVEVLRGPQGTLYGRNTTAGVFNLITHKADPTLGGYVQGTYGNYNNVKLDGAINLPLGPNLSTRLAAMYLDREGYSHNLYNGHNVDGRKMYALRSSTHLDLGETTADLVVDYFHERDNRAYQSKVFCTKDATTGCSGVSAGLQTPDARTTIFQLVGQAIGLLTPGVDYFAGAVNPTDLRTINQDIDPTYYSQQWNGSLELKHNFGAVSLTSLTGFQSFRQDIFNDFDHAVATTTMARAVTYDLYANGNPITSNLIQSGRRDAQDGHQWSQELRLDSKLSGPFNFLLGANYLDYSLHYLLHITHPTIAALAQIKGVPAVLQDYEIETAPATSTSYGLFGEAYFAIDTATKLTAGLRYSHDHKHILTRETFIFDNPPIPAFTVGDYSKGVVTGRVVLDHQFSREVMGYASFSRGYKAGGINPGGATVPTFAPEYLNALEAGLKTRTADGLLTFNASAFYYDYKGLQIGQVGTTSANTVNADAKIYGAEFEWVAKPAPRLQIDGSLSLLHTEITKFQSADQGDPLALASNSAIVRDAAGNPVRASDGSILKDLSGNRLPFSPGIKLAVGVQYVIPLDGGWVLTPRVDHFQQGRFYGTEFNKPEESLKGYSQTDIKLTLAAPGERWQLRGYVKNLFNHADIVRFTQEGPLVGRFRNVVLLDPRTYGVELTARF